MLLVAPILVQAVLVEPRSVKVSGHLRYTRACVLGVNTHDASTSQRAFQRRWLLAGNVDCAARHEQYASAKTDPHRARHEAHGTGNSHHPDHQSKVDQQRFVHLAAARVRCRLGAHIRTTAASCQVCVPSDDETCISFIQILGEMNEY